MRLVSYNIFNGLEKSQAYGDLVRWLEPLDVPLVLFNEYRTRTSGAGLDEAMRAAGYVWSEVGASGTNRVAVFSRGRFDVVVNSEAVRLVAVEIDGLRIVSWHASPRGVTRVLEELPTVLELAQGHDDVLVAGDLNSLAHADQAIFDYQSHIAMLGRYCDDDSLSFEVLHRLEQAGLRDLNVDLQRYTVPTDVGRKVEGGVRARLDHALGKGKFAKRWLSRIIRCQTTDHLSDHYPLLIEPVA